MPLITARSRGTHSLWRAFSDSVLGDLGAHRGPGGYPAAVWLTHRLHRDRLYEEAARRGCTGWLNPPISFFSELPERFGLPARPVGLVERRALLDRTASRLHRGAPAPGLSAAADQLFAELLPEGITADQLEAALRSLPADEFSLARNRMLVELLREYLAELGRLGRYDARAVHAAVAARVDQGGLPAVLDGARRLHIYGLTSTHTRGVLLRSLAAQPDVEVVLYLLENEATAAEWEQVLPHADFGRRPEEKDKGDSGTLRIQPVPDEYRELGFIALEVKRQILERGTAPDRIAVVARTGRADARMAFEALERAGIPATGRLRSSLDEIPALKAVMLLIRGAATGWSYRPLRQLLESSYFDLPVDLRKLDEAAAERRISGLAEWRKQLPDVEALSTLALEAERLAAPRPAREWTGITRELLSPGWFRFRERVCRAPGEQWDLVRLDQQGILTLAALLTDWASAETDDTKVSITQWYDRLRRFLGANELALSTPLKTGVQVLEAHEAALVPFDHVFLMHANDGEFPKAYRPGGLLTLPERKALAEFGLPIGHLDLALRRERALWDAVTSGPATTITYRTTEANGTPLLPSLLVPPPEHSKHEAEIPRAQFVWDTPFTHAHADRQAMRSFATRKERGAQPVPRPGMLSRGLLAGVAESHRLGSPDGSRLPGVLGPWNGELRDPALLQALGERFGSEYLWSPSQLESYAQNPFMFFLQRVLHIEEREEAEEDTSIQTLGTFGHTLLERFHREFEGRLPVEFAIASEALDRIASAAFAEAEQEGLWRGLPAMWVVRRRQIVENVRQYLAWELPKLGQWVPRYFEFSFGYDSRAAARLEQRDRTGQLSNLRLRGKIDRVDVKDGAHRVVDYKSGTIPGRKGYLDGATLQSALYMAALGASGLTPAEAEYRSIRQRKTSARIAWGDQDATRALSLAHSIPARVRSGKFEPCAASSCGWKNYWPGGIALVRVAQELADGECRFDG